MFFNVVFEVDHTPIALRVFEDDLGDITLNLRSEIALNLVYDVALNLVYDVAFDCVHEPIDPL